MIYEAVLFDMDGVIIDSYQSVTDFWQELAAAHKVHLTHADLLEHAYGRQATDTLSALFPELSPEDYQAAFARMERYEVGLAFQPIPGVIDLLRALKQSCVPTALVTSGRTWKVDAVTRQLGLEGLFTVKVMANDIQRGKPDPDCYLMAAERLHKAPEVCIVFEDAPIGVQAAMAAGALCIGVQSWPSANSLREAGARYLVPDFRSVELVSPAKAATPFHLRLNGNQELPLSVNP